MNLSFPMMKASQEFLNFFRAGKEAARRGDNTQAHTLFRRAIEVDPYHEQVWLWLATVVDTDEDRRVCFENVLELTPANPTARRQLEHLENKALGEINKPPRQRRTQWLSITELTIVLLAFIAAILLALTFI
jgi:hypothetical protein